LSSYGIWKTTDTHSALAMARKCILSCEACATWALVRLVSGVDLRVALQVMLADKALATSVALELTISKVCLNVRSDVFSSSEDLAAALVKARPLARRRILFTDVSLNFFWCNAGVLKACIYL
jgi:hypothetical protein